MTAAVGALVAVALVLLGSVVPAAAEAVGRAGAAGAAGYLPAILFDETGKFDKSFNESALTGAERYRAITGNRYLAFEPRSIADKGRLLRKAAGEADLVVAVGFRWRPLLDTVARAHPETRFALIDAVLDRPNVHCITFAEHEGAFLAGVLAGMATRSRTVGFIGGMDVPLIHRFRVGFMEGARWQDPAITVLWAMTGDTPAAFNDPFAGSELAYEQIDAGADVLFAAAGATGLGVYEAAADARVLAIGVDSNQNYLHPGTMLTSMVKRVDRAVFVSFRTGADEAWQPGHHVLGLEQGGVGLAFDRHNRALVDHTMRARVAEARQAIIAGTLEVTDYLNGPGGQTH